MGCRQSREYHPGSSYRFERVKDSIPLAHRRTGTSPQPSAPVAPPPPENPDHHHQVPETVTIATTTSTASATPSVTTTTTAASTIKKTASAPKNHEPFASHTEYLAHVQTRRAGRQLLCHICCSHGGEVVIPKDKVTNRCHGTRTVCVNCLKNHIREAIAKQQYDSITCLCGSGDGRCSQVLRYRHVRKHADPSDFERYDQGLLRRTLESQAEFRWCATPGCGSGQLHPRQAQQPRMRCHACHQSTCFTHRCAWHTGRSCPDYDRDAARSDEVALLQWLETKQTQRCPNCQNGVERNGGCDHMTCRCQHEFCWRCLAPYNGPGGIRRRGRSAHKTSCPHYRAPSGTSSS